MSGKCRVMKEALPGHAGKCRRYANVARFPSECRSSRAIRDRPIGESPRNRRSTPGKHAAGDLPRPIDYPRRTRSRALHPRTATVLISRKLRSAHRPPIHILLALPFPIFLTVKSLNHHHSSRIASGGVSRQPSPAHITSADRCLTTSPLHRPTASLPHCLTAPSPHCPISPLPLCLIAPQLGPLAASQLSRRCHAAADMAGIQLPGGNLRSLRSGSGARGKGQGARGKV
jgi:hypothetical protein